MEVRREEDLHRCSIHLFCCIPQSITWKCLSTSASSGVNPGGGCLRHLGAWPCGSTLGGANTKLQQPLCSVPSPGHCVPQPWLCLGSWQSPAKFIFLVLLNTEGMPVKGLCCGKLRLGGAIQQSEIGDMVGAPEIPRREATLGSVRS